MKSFQTFYERALERKGGPEALARLLPPVRTPVQLAQTGDSRYLSMLAKGINQAGFRWQVIEDKWPQFEEAMAGFNPKALALWPQERWENLMLDTRVVRSWQKISAVQKTAIMIYNLALDHGSAAQFFAHWPRNDQLGLALFLKKNGGRLGGMTGPVFLRRMGWDAYLVSPDVVLTLQQAGLDIDDNPTSQKDQKRIQQAFNGWHDETGLPYSHISKIAAFANGENRPAEKNIRLMYMDMF